MKKKTRSRVQRKLIVGRIFNFLRPERLPITVHTSYLYVEFLIFLPYNYALLSLIIFFYVFRFVSTRRQSEKIIVPADVPSRAAETAASSTTKDPAYKRFARKLCGGGAGCGGGRRRPTKASSVAAADSRSSKCWTAVWKRRPRWCGGPRCCGRKRKDAGRPTAAVAAAGAAEAGDRRPQWWRRCKPCWCCGKRKKRLGASSDSVGVLGISPPSADTFCGKFKRRLCCCCGCCVVPKFFRRLCCCCPCCGGSGKRPDVPKSKSADTQRPSLFKCTGCCTVSTSCPAASAIKIVHVHTQTRKVKTVKDGQRLRKSCLERTFNLGLRGSIIFVWLDKLRNPSKTQHVFGPWRFRLKQFSFYR